MVTKSRAIRDANWTIKQDKNVLNRQGVRDRLKKKANVMTPSMSPFGAKNKNPRRKAAVAVRAKGYSTYAPAKKRVAKKMASGYNPVAKAAKTAAIKAITRKLQRSLSQAEAAKAPARKAKAAKAPARKAKAAKAPARKAITRKRVLSGLQVFLPVPKARNYKAIRPKKKGKRAKKK